MNSVHIQRENLEKEARRFVENLTPGKNATVIGLFGDLGAGKTTFTQTVARILGVTETVTSPTFVIEKIYKLNGGGALKGVALRGAERQSRDTASRPSTRPFFTHLIHIDAYRLESGSELLKLGWRDIAADPKNLIMIEWPEKVADILPSDMKKLHFTFIDEKTREIIYG